MTLKRALITGITGQDGSYLAELLLEKGYEVHGLIRRSSQFNTQRIDHLYVDPHESDTRLFLHYADLTDSSSLIGHLHQIKPAEVYNLGAQSHVKVSFEMPEFTSETAGMGTLRLLEAIRTADWPIRYLPGGVVGDVRTRAGVAAERAHAVQPAQPVRDRQALRALHDHQLPRGVRPPRQQRDPLQPRVAATRRHIRDPEGHAGHRRDPGRQGRAPLPRQPRRQARLGLRQGVRRGDVADAPAGRARRLRHRHRRDAHRPRAVRGRVRAGRSRVGPLRPHRRAVFPSDRSRRAVRRRVEGRRPTRLAPDDRVHRPRRPHARPRSARKLASLGPVPCPTEASA